MIPFNKSIRFKNLDITKLNKLSGDGDATYKVTSFLQDKIGYKNVLLTTSCTSALDMIAMLIDINRGDEIIAPSFTFVSSVNSFVSRGAFVKFVDIRNDTLNIDENRIESAITNKTKAIILVHYAGVACEMDKIMEIARVHNLIVIEDAAQAIGSKYKGKLLGTFGNFATLSFHETKNFSMGEGGALIVNDDSYFIRAQYIREKGTNRTKFIAGEVDKYTWIDMGSSFLPSDINALYLLKQFEIYDEIVQKRKVLWERYYTNLTSYTLEISLPILPDFAEGNNHIFYIKVSNEALRESLRKFLLNNDILAVSHYIPLHSSPFGKQVSEFIGEDLYTSVESGRLIRLPIFYDLTLNEVDYICSKIRDFFEKYEF